MTYSPNHFAQGFLCITIMIDPRYTTTRQDIFQTLFVCEVFMNSITYNQISVKQFRLDEICCICGEN